MKAAGGLKGKLAVPAALMARFNASACTHARLFSLAPTCMLKHTCVPVQSRTPNMHATCIHTCSIHAFKHAVICVCLPQRPNGTHAPHELGAGATLSEAAPIPDSVAEPVQAPAEPDAHALVPASAAAVPEQLPDAAARDVATSAAATVAHEGEPARLPPRPAPLTPKPPGPALGLPPRHSQPHTPQQDALGAIVHPGSAADNTSQSQQVWCAWNGAEE